MWKAIEFWLARQVADLMIALAIVLVFVLAFAGLWAWAVVTSWIEARPGKRMARNIQRRM